MAVAGTALLVFSDELVIEDCLFDCTWLDRDQVLVVEAELAWSCGLCGTVVVSNTRRFTGYEVRSQPGPGAFWRRRGAVEHTCAADHVDREFVELLTAVSISA